MQLTVPPGLRRTSSDAAPHTKRRTEHPTRSKPFGVTLTPQEIAEAIDVPKLLPPNYKGDRLDHLSASSITKFEICPDDWRRHYLLGERGPQNGPMFIGKSVDGVLGSYYERILHDEDPMTAAELQETLRLQWDGDLERSEQHERIAWGQNTTAADAYDAAAEVVEVFRERIIPRLGRPVATQRRIELTISAAVDWSVIGFVDLETVRPQRGFVTAAGELLAVEDTGDPEPTVKMPWDEAPVDVRPELKVKNPTRRNPNPVQPEPPDVAVPISMIADGGVIHREVAGVVDYKVKRKPIYQATAAGDVQAGIYLAERWLAGNPAHDFTFAQAARAEDGVRQNASATLTRTTRTEAQMRQVFARIAAVASQIDAFYQVLGPEKPWGFAPAGHWKCSPDESRQRGKYCQAWRNCPMGRGFE